MQFSKRPRCAAWLVTTTKGGQRRPPASAAAPYTEAVSNSSPPGPGPPSCPLRRPKCRAWSPTRRRFYQRKQAMRASYGAVSISSSSWQDCAAMVHSRTHVQSIAVIWAHGSFQHCRVVKLAYELQNSCSIRSRGDSEFPQPLRIPHCRGAR